MTGSLCCTAEISIFCFSTMNYYCLVTLHFRAAPATYESSQARGRIGAVATGLRQSHSNAGSKLRLQPTPQFTAMPDPQPTEQCQRSNPQPHGSQLDSLTTAPRQELQVYSYCYLIITTVHLQILSSQNEILYPLSYNSPFPNAPSPSCLIFCESGC